MRGLWLRLRIGLLAAALLPTVVGAAEPDRTAIALEALSRLKRVDLNANPALKTAVLKVLESTRGTPQFVQIVQQFKLSDQGAGLLEVAIKHPAEAAGVDAMRLLLFDRDTRLVQEALQGTDVAKASKTAEALGNASDRRATALLLPVAQDPQRDAGLRKQAVRSLARTREGATELLRLAKAEQLSSEVKFTASTELNHARWPDVQAEAAKVLPLPPGKNAQPLPPVSQLLAMKGDPANGAQVFARPEVGCAKCHRVRDLGVDFGPALAEIGSKLGKDALYEAILDPSAGISLGFEAWEIERKNDEPAYGIIVSETADEMVLKDAQAIPLRIPKSDLVTRRQMKTSIMPAGLQMTMSAQELVDLVEYLATLTKK